MDYIRKFIGSIPFKTQDYSVAVRSLTTIISDNDSTCQQV